MTQRGRKSGDALSVATVSDLSSVPRIKVPAHLGDAQADVWQRVVNDKPADWFSKSNIDLLNAYAQAVVDEQRIAQLIESVAADPDMDVGSYLDLVRRHGEHGARVTALATKLRLTPQSLTNHRGNTQKKAVQKPWES